MASSVNSVGSSNNVTDPTPKQTGFGNNVADAGVFLQLLVSQLKNQDPLNPSDSTQFVTQLAQFSQLENTIGIKTNTDTIAKNTTAANEAAEAAAAAAAAMTKKTSTN